MLEAWLSRGDRRMAEVVYRAWKHGARFDAWQETSHLDAWYKAFEECQLDPDFYTHRVRYIDEIFPWDHINPGVKKTFLAQDYRWSLEGKIRQDCRQQCFACGILPTFAQTRRENPGEVWKCPEVSQGRVRAVDTLQPQEV